MDDSAQRASTWDGTTERRRKVEAPDCHAGRKSWTALNGDGPDKPGVFEWMRNMDSRTQAIAEKIDAALQPKKTPWWVSLLVACAVIVTACVALGAMQR